MFLLRNKHFRKDSYFWEADDYFWDYVEDDCFAWLLKSARLHGDMWAIYRLSDMRCLAMSKDYTP